MAFESDSLNRRSIGPVIASAVVGAALGIVAVVGAGLLSSGESPATGTANAQTALLGDPEYGTRQ